MPITKSQVKYIQSLGHKKFRDQEGVFVVEGPKTVEELLNAPNMRTVAVYATKEWKGAATEVSDSELERLSSLSTPNQVLAVFEKPSFPPPVFNNTISLVLDGIQDPGNLGTIVRIADWFGIPRVWCSRDSADVFSAKAVQSTMGSIGRVQVLYGDPGELIRDHPALPVYAAVLEGKDLYGQKRIREGLIVIGNESRGIRSGWLAPSAHALTIPRIGQAESLNAAVATGIILSHLVGG
ncbi:MAG TPA: RNA methyltransferase [Puia sp.]|jgi:TrmH family RNA methyltransferase